MSGGFLRFREGILEHLRMGKVGPLHAAVLAVMSLQAQWDTGLWIGSPQRLHGDMPWESEHTYRQTLKHLSRIKWIRGWSTQGEGKATTHYLIDKFEATSGRNKGKRLNLSKTESWGNPIFEEIEQGELKEGSGRPQGKGFVENSTHTKTKTSDKDKDGEAGTAAAQPVEPPAQPAEQGSIPPVWSSPPKAEPQAPPPECERCANTRRVPSQVTDDSQRGYHFEAFPCPDCGSVGATA